MRNEDRAPSAFETGRIVMFLDLDGVAHAVGDSRIDDLGSLVGENMFRWVHILDDILREYPEVDVVVHSSWRVYWPTLESLSALLPPSLARRVTAITDPDIMGRHNSIQRYLEQHPRVVSHVIVDDERGAFPPGLPQLVLCDSKAGLSDPATARRLRKALATARTQSASQCKAF